MNGIRRRKSGNKILKRRISTQVVRGFVVKWALVLPSHRLVYSSALEWVPQGDQESDFADAPCKPASDNILLAKLRPGQVRTLLILSGLVTEYFILQEISMTLHAIKSNGMDHAKWSPVGADPVPASLQNRKLTMST